MVEGLEAFGAWALPVVWVPLAAWTLVWLAAEAVLAGGLRQAHPALRYRVAQAALLALPVGLALAAVVEVPAFRSAPPLITPLPAEPLPFVFEEAPVQELPAEPFRTFSWMALLGGLTLTAAALAAVQGVRLAAHAVAFRRLRREVLAEPGGEVVEVEGVFGLCQRVRVVASEACPVPMAFGTGRPVVALPASLAGEARALALAHELAHVRQGDYAAQWAEALTAAAFAVHPGVHRLRRRCSLLREMACDAALLAEPGVSRRAYAALVLSYVVPPAPAHPAAVGMADSRPHVHQRLKAMSARLLPRPPRPLAWALALAVLLGGSLTLTAAQGFTAEPSAPLAEALPPGAASDTVFVLVEQMPELVGGLEGVQQRLRYPEEARAAGAEGTVFIQFVVDAEGRVVDPVVVRGAGSALDEAALEAVRQSEFTPGRQRGEAVPVRMSLPVRFRLNADGDATPGAARPDSEVFVVVEQMPELIGGLDGLQQRLRYPELARNAGIEGTVFVEFVVDEEGRVVDPQVRRGIGGGADEAALAAVREARFTPGRQRGETVKVRMTVPIRFRLDGEAARAAGAGSAPPELHARILSVQIERGEHDGPGDWVQRGVVRTGEEPVAGANVTLETEGRSFGAVTGPDGQFVLRVPTAQIQGGGQIVITHPSFERGELRLYPFGGTEPSGPPDGFSVHGAFPNPSTGEVRLTLALPAEAEVSVEVYDAAGRRVHRTEPHRLAAGDRQTLTLDASGLAAGVYTFRASARAGGRTHTAAGTFTVVR